MDDEHDDFEMKVCTLGDASVGKTNILLRYFEDRFDVAGQPTIGFDHMSKELDLEVEPSRERGHEKAKKKILLKIWDTAGQERFQTFTNAIFQGTGGFILVYDVTSQRSFDSIDKWLRLISERSEISKPRILLLGNKIDLDAKRVVSIEQGRSVAKSHDMLFMEVSALENKAEEINRAIDSLVQSIAGDQHYEIFKNENEKFEAANIARVIEDKKTSEKKSQDNKCC